MVTWRRHLSLRCSVEAPKLMGNATTCCWKNWTPVFLPWTDVVLNCCGFKLMLLNWTTVGWLKEQYKLWYDAVFIMVFAMWIDSVLSRKEMEELLTNLFQASQTRTPTFAKTSVVILITWIHLMFDWNRKKMFATELGSKLRNHRAAGNCMQCCEGPALQIVSAPFWDSELDFSKWSEKKILSLQLMI